MPQNEQSQQKNLKPGSNSQDARAVGGKGDFGAAESDTINRDYVSHNTKASDPGHANPHAGSDSREVGAGVNAGGAGSGSGGDVDPDILGIGTGRALSQSGPDNFPAGSPDESVAPSRTSPTGTNTPNKKAPPQKLGGGTGRAGSVTPDTGDASTGQDAQGADAVTNANPQDDAFAGEISSGEAGGQDNSRSDQSS